MENLKSCQADFVDHKVNGAGSGWSWPDHILPSGEVSGVSGSISLVGGVSGATGGRSMISVLGESGQVASGAVLVDLC